MATAQDKILQYLNEAHATELALVQTLTAHIAMTPSGTYRKGLEKHLDETRGHAKQLEERLGELGQGRNLIQMSYGAFSSLVGQVLALSKGPLDMLRGGSAEEKLVKNAKDECATEALEIATYISLERVAKAAGDEETAKLAVKIRGDEEKMLDKLQRELPKLTDAAMKAEIDDEGSYDISTTGAAEAVKTAGKTAQRTAGKAATRARTSARQARRVPGVARAEGEVKGAAAGADELPISNYDELSAEDVGKRLGELSQIDLAKIDAYERKNQNRTTVLSRLDSLRGDEPWPGYDEQTVDDIKKAVQGADEERRAAVRDYERRHKGRQGVLQAIES
jgi:ferritin-like metal-binding protein YciE